jgi:uncharacterized damage-inducible protein DinB
MKTYFTRLFNYDRYANELILKSMLEASSIEKPVQLMAHLLSTPQVWLSRCKKEIKNVEIFPDLEVSTFKPMIEENHRQWLDFIENVNNLDEIIYYKNSSGNAFNNTIVEILTHVINHGTHHRAQIGQQLKVAGIEKLPVTDYIFFARENI